LPEYNRSGWTLEKRTLVIGFEFWRRKTGFGAAFVVVASEAIAKENHLYHMTKEIVFKKIESWCLLAIDSRIYCSTFRQI